LDVDHRRRIHRLSASAVKRSKPGLHPDGGGLYLQVTEAKSGGLLNRSWLFRYKVGKNRDRWMGGGSVHTITLVMAREWARQARVQRCEGIDPIEQRKATRAAKAQADAKAITFAQAVHGYEKAHAPGWRNAKHARDWSASLRKYVLPMLGSVPVSSIDTALILKCLGPLWERIPETAMRILNRVRKILDWATAGGYRTGENPARWVGHLDQLLLAPGKAKLSKHLAAMEIPDVPEFMGRLRDEAGTAARALEFGIINAARTGEVFGARWDEIEGDVWIIPGSRMKSGREHKVPLSRRALEILEQMAAQRTCDLVFPGRDGSSPLGQTALRQVMKRLGRSDVAVHGFRSTFRDWCGDHTNFPREVAEAALAHVIGDRVEAAYRRGSALEKRRELMQAWSRYCAAAPAPAAKGKVVPIGSAR
jgi:integrase